MGSAVTESCIDSAPDRSVEDASAQCAMTPFPQQIQIGIETHGTYRFRTALVDSKSSFALPIPKVWQTKRHYRYSLLAGGLPIRAGNKVCYRKSRRRSGRQYRWATMQSQ